MLYKVGQKVKLKPREELIGCESVVNIEEMLRFGGCTMTIKEVFEKDDAYYLLEDEHEFYWSEDCFCKFSIKELREFPIDVKETIKEKTSETRQLLEKFDTLLNEFQELRDRLYDLEKNKEKKHVNNESK